MKFLKQFHNLEKDIRNAQLMNFNTVLFAVLATILLLHYIAIFPYPIDTIILATVAIAAMVPVGLRTVQAVQQKKVTFDLLVTIALLASLLGRELTSAVFIGLMLTSARMLALYTEQKAHHAIQSLFKLKPKKARVKIGAEVHEVATSSIKKGDIVVVELGERIPVDGVIVHGEASVDQSSLTGESLPLDKKVGDLVLSSTNVVSGNLLIRAERVGKETTLEKIIQLVEEAQTAKPNIVTFSDMVAVWYSIIVLLGIMLIYVVSHNLPLILSFILVVSAEDIAIAIPLAFVAGIGHAAKQGVIIKGGDFLDGLRKTKVMMVDKTGTLTYGKLRVKDFFVFENWKREEVLGWAATATSLSNHPSAKAIIAFAREQKITWKQPDTFAEKSGSGTMALVGNKRVLIGKPAYLKEENVRTTQHALRDIEREKEKGFNTTLIAYDGQLVGFFVLADEVRPHVKDIISELKRLGIEKIVMLSGDNEKIAERIARHVGITDYHANLLPEDKLTYLKKYLNPAYKVLAAGDGVNDAALLNAADIGVAMGGIGADVTIESGDIVLMQDNLSRLPELVKLSRFTLNIAYQDLILWAIINGTGLLLVFSGFLTPTAAAAWNFIGDFPPLLNSARLLRLRRKEQ